MAKVNGIGLIAVAGGGLLLYSAIFGKGFSSEVRTLLAGEAPSKAQAANPIDVFNSGPGGPTITGQTGVVVPSGPGETAWIDALLQSIGAPKTQANVDSIAAWISHEGPFGTQGENNPLNTSYTGAPGYAGKWSAAPIVSMYSTVAGGIQATVDTLQSYPNILSALQSGQGLCGNSSVSSELASWSGGGYSSVCLRSKYGRVNRNHPKRYRYICGKRLVSDQRIPVGYRCSGIIAYNVYVRSRETKRTPRRWSIEYLSYNCHCYAYRKGKGVSHRRTSGIG